MKGWLFLFLYVAAYDAWAASTGQPTLSAHYAQALDKHPVLVSAGTGFLVLHLVRRFPRWLDPFVGYAALWKR